MRLMAKTFLIGGSSVVLAILGLAGCRHKPKVFKQKDTPIVAGGGSIYGTTYEKDTDGWQYRWWAVDFHHSASLHADGANKDGIDYLTFDGINNPPTNPVSHTQGWAISISNVGPDKTKMPNAARFCSDPSCSASAKKFDGTNNPNVCKKKFNPNARVYFEVRAGEKLLESGSPVNRLDFHDPSAACNPAGCPNACDVVFDITLETCDHVAHPTMTCQTDPSTKKQICRIMVGKDH